MHTARNHKLLAGSHGLEEKVNRTLMCGFVLANKKPSRRIGTPRRFVTECRVGAQWSRRAALRLDRSRIILNLAKE